MKRTTKTKFYSCFQFFLHLTERKNTLLSVLITGYIRRSILFPDLFREVFLVGIWLRPHNARIAVSCLYAKLRSSECYFPLCKLPQKCKTWTWHGFGWTGWEVVGGYEEGHEVKRCWTTSFRRKPINSLFIFAPVVNFPERFEQISWITLDTQINPTSTSVNLTLIFLKLRSGSQLRWTFQAGGDIYV